MNKAANEIKIRLRECLECVLAPDDSPAARELWDRYRLSAADLRPRYRLSTDELRGRVEAALGELENSQIGTIHSFAAHLLRLYPLEAGVDPRFTPDEEFVFDDFFTREWRGGGGGGARGGRGAPGGRGKGRGAPRPGPPGGVAPRPRPRPPSLPSRPDP